MAPPKHPLNNLCMHPLSGRQHLTRAAKWTSVSPWVQGKLRAPMSAMWDSGAREAAGGPDARYDPWTQDVLEFKVVPARYPAPPAASPNAVSALRERFL